MPAKTSRSNKSGKKKSVRESKFRLPLFEKFERTATYLPALGLLLVIGLLFLNEVGVSVFDLFGSDNDFFAESSEIYDADAALAELFHPAVQYWEPAIYGWAQEVHLNPNIIATIMQIESCGNPYIASGVGAQGLAQVMPSNFQAGDNQLDLNTNVHTGMQILRDCLRWSGDPDFDGHQDRAQNIGLALACYNGGPGMINRSQQNWPDETRSYYDWGTGIWAEASQGQPTSNTLSRWLEAGGVNLCNRALAVQEQFDPIQALVPPS